jgi:hypothetical protein
MNSRHLTLETGVHRRQMQRLVYFGHSVASRRRKRVSLWSSYESTGSVSMPPIATLMAIHMHKKLPVILTTAVIAVRFLSIDVVTGTAGDHASV